MKVTHYREVARSAANRVYDKYSEYVTRDSILEIAGAVPAIVAAILYLGDAIVYLAKTFQEKDK